MNRYTGPRHPKVEINGKLCRLEHKKVVQASGNSYFYWYAFWMENGRRCSKYLGKNWKGLGND